MPCDKKYKKRPGLTHIKKRLGASQYCTLNILILVFAYLDLFFKKLLQGIIAPTGEIRYEPMMTIAMKEERAKNLISLNSSHLIDIPPHMTSIYNYRASLGHKVISESFTQVEYCGLSLMSSYDDHAA